MDSSAWVLPVIDKVAIQIGPIAVHWYGLMYLVGLLSAWGLANWRAGKYDIGWTKEQVSDAIFISFLGVVLGGRLGYIFFYDFAAFIDNPIRLFKIWQGGMSFHGGFLGVCAAFFFIGRKFNKSFLQISDFFAPFVPIGLGAGRIGNFINGELWGRQTEGFWAVVFPNDPDKLPRHASQLYEFALEGVVLFIILMLFSLKSRPAGAISGLFSLGYGTFRFIIEYAREPDAHLGLFGGFISMGQILSLPMIILGIILLVFAYKKPAA